MLWLLIALIEPFCHAIANLGDSFLTNNHFRPATLVFYVALAIAPMLGLLYLFGSPQLPSAGTLAVLALLAVNSYVVWMLYYYSLNRDDTSVVVSLFDLGKIFVPIFAFVFVGERLLGLQYLGFILIIAAGLALTWAGGWKRIQLKASFWLMAACSLLISAEMVTFKYLLVRIDWVTALFWQNLFFVVFAVLLTLSVPSLRADIRKQRTSAWKLRWVILGTQSLIMIGLAGRLAAISLAPVTLVEAVVGIQAIIVLFATVVAHRAWPRLFREAVDWPALRKKFFFMAVMVFGVWMTVAL